jgi:hypothetical protein
MDTAQTEAERSRNGLARVTEFTSGRYGGGCLICSNDFPKAPTLEYVECSLVEHYRAKHTDLSENSCLERKTTQVMSPGDDARRND